MKRISIIGLLTTATLSLLLSGSMGRMAVARVETSQDTRQVIVLRAARMLDVQAGRVISPAVVVIERDRIKSVNPANIPRGQIIDLGDITLLPGFIDAHTHLSFDIEGAWIHRSVTDTASDYALRGARNSRNTLLAGFTTVRDLGSRHFADVALMRAIEQEWSNSPMRTGRLGFFCRCSEQTLA